MAVLSSSSVSQKKPEDNIACDVFGDKTNEGATKQKAYMIPSNRITTKPKKTVKAGTRL